MHEDEFDRVVKRFNGLNEIIKKLYDLVEEIKWDAGKNELKDIGNEFEKINSNVLSLKSQRDIIYDQFEDKGTLTTDQYKKNIGELVKKLSGNESDLDKIMPSFKRFAGNMKSFIKKEGINKEAEKVIDGILTKLKNDTSSNERTNEVLPDDKAIYNKGKLLIESGKYEDAIKCFDKAIDINQKFAAAWLFKGEALFSLKRYDEAIQCLKKAIEIDPGLGERITPSLVGAEKGKKPIFGGKIQSIVDEIRFGEWLLSFLGEDASEKQNDMIGHLTGKLSEKREKKIVSGYSYWGIEPTNAWDHACHDKIYIMEKSIEKFPNNWIKLYYSLPENDKSYSYVSLGVGTGKKDVSVLTSLIEKNSNIKYFPIDLSPEMLYAGTTYVRRNTKNLKGCQILPLQADFSNKTRLKEIKCMLKKLIEKEPIIYGLLGNTLSNFDDDLNLLENLSEILLEPDDFLLLELAKTNEINKYAMDRAALEYDPPAFKEFAISSLKQITNHDVNISWVDIEPDIDEKKSIKIFTWYKNKSEKTIDLLNELSFTPEDKIRLYLSRKYTDEGVNDLLEHSNLKKHNNYLVEYSSGNIKFGVELLLLKKPP